MKKLFATFLAVALAIGLTACATTSDGSTPSASPQEIAAKVCPPLQAVMVVFEHADDATVPPAVKADIAKVAPLIDTACASGATLGDLHDLASNGIPLALQVVDVLPISAQERNVAVLALAAAQAAILATK